MKVSDQLNVLAVLPPRNNRVTHRIEGWVRHKASLADFLKSSLTPVRNRTADRQAPSLVTTLSTL
jgi:hypothetical protein